MTNFFFNAVTWDLCRCYRSSVPSASGIIGCAPMSAVDDTQVYYPYKVSFLLRIIVSTAACWSNLASLTPLMSSHQVYPEYPHCTRLLRPTVREEPSLNRHAFNTPLVLNINIQSLG